MTILVTGATGTVGRDIVGQLVASGLPVRALTRNPATARLPEGVEVVAGDLTKPDDLPAALDGVEQAFLNMGEDNGSYFAKAAATAGLKQVVLLSSFTVGVDWPSGNNIIAARHRIGENALTEAGVPSTFLRPSGFDYNIVQWTRTIADEGVVRAPFGDVALPLIHPRDIASAAVAALTDQGHAGGAYVLTGPAKITVAEQVSIIGEVLGRPVRYEEISLEQARDYYPEGLPGFVVDSILEVLGPDASALEPTGDVQELTGKSPLTFADWAREHTAAFLARPTN